jgi:hypothetical protein
VVKCSGVSQYSDGLSNKVSNIIRRLMDNMKLLIICILRVLLSQYFLSMYEWFYSCLIMQFMYFYCYDYILIVCLCMSTLTGGFPCFFLSCKTNARVKPAKTAHGLRSS